MEEEYTFAANNSSDPAEAKKVIAGLKRIAKFGEHAKHVLKEIEEHGFYNGRGAYVEQLGVHPPVYQFKIGSFPKIEKITRKNISKFGDYKIKFNNLTIGNKNYYNNKDEIPVHLVGEEKLVWDGENISKEKLNDVLGYVRLLKKGFSFRHSRTNYYSARTYKVFVRHDSVGGQEAMQAMGENIAEKLTQYNQYDHEVPYIMKDLRKMIPRWLKEDGVLEKLFKSFKDYGGVQKIMVE